MVNTSVKGFKTRKVMLDSLNPKRCKSETFIFFFTVMPLSKALQISQDFVSVCFVLFYAQGKLLR